ncbi:uncharacterized protein LOC116198955 [Punica granatum]|uniref:Uncharacterized protein LOC116198955 n=2 Tax=Punica granatum TaxID=22663 RepID=A0A6P8D0M1_PUNGR|nr:uncharacterized protein LOC116198955 [Punica granatum]PKI59935.1 hypothetical protein CRG98_019708 [Punica granatum]
MKRAKVEAENLGSAAKGVASPPPPPPLPPLLPRSWARRTASAECITNREIAEFWRRKRTEEEDHLLAAIKAAARVRARKFSADNYKHFIESLEDADDDPKGKNSDTAASRNTENYENEVRVGIKDWWTKSNYAYLNQPALGLVEKPRSRASSYTPNCFSYKPTPFYATSLGVF